MNSVCFSPISVQPWTALVNCSFKVEEFPNKMAISFSEFQRQFILSQKTDGIRASFLNIKSHSFLFCLLISSSLSLMLSCISSKVPLGFTAAFGRPSASLESCHLLPFRVLSKTQFQKTFPLNAGATKGVNSPAAHRGKCHAAGATRS